MQLRNCILIALAFDATEEEVAHAHEVIDRVAGGIDPSILVSASVNSGTGVIETTGTGNAISNTTAAAATNADLDAAGLPWDDRIHSSNKKKNDKGLWWAKRGVTPALKGKVEKELRDTLAANGGAAVQSTPAISTPAPVTGAPALPGSGLPPMPGSNLPPLPGAAAVDPAYTALVQLIAANTQSAANPQGRITDDWVKQVLTHYGVADGNLQNLAHAPQLVPQIDAYIKSALGS